MRMRLSPVSKFFVYFFLVLMVLITLLPLIYVVSGSFKTNMEIMLGGVNPFPKEPTFDNFKTVWGMSGSTQDSQTTYADYTVNSIMVSALTVVITVFFTRGVVFNHLH